VTRPKPQQKTLKAKFKNAYGKATDSEQKPVSCGKVENKPKPKGRHAVEDAKAKCPGGAT